MTGDRACNLISIFAAALCAIGFYMIGLDNVQPISVVEYSVANTGPVPRNGSLLVHYKINVERACSGEGQRVFSDAGHQVYPAVPFEFEDGRLSDGQVVQSGQTLTETVKVNVPNGAAPGPATYQNQTQFFCNWLQRLTRHGIAFDYPLINFTISSETLPKVEPSTSIFKPIRKIYNPMRWFNDHLPFSLPVSKKEIDG